MRGEDLQSQKDTVQPDSFYFKYYQVNQPRNIVWEYWNKDWIRSIKL